MGKKFKSLFRDMVKCPNGEQLKRKLEAIRLESNEAYQDLMNRGPKSLCKAYIQTWCKFDMIDNNICKTINSYIRKGREKPLIDMLEYIRENLMERTEKQVRIITMVKDTICPRIRKKLEGIRNNTRHCIANPTVGEFFQVAMFREQFTAGVRARECSCRCRTLTSILFKLSCHYV